MSNTLASFVPQLSAEIGSATGASHAETCNAQMGIITTESLTTAAAAVEERTLTNSFIAAGSNVIVNMIGGTNTRYAVIPYVKTVAAGSAVIEFTNAHASALNGTLVYSFLVL